VGQEEIVNKMEGSTNARVSESLDGAICVGVGENVDKLSVEFGTFVPNSENIPGSREMGGEKFLLGQVDFGLPEGQDVVVGSHAGKAGVDSEDERSRGEGRD
jgi:hypothetical protein